MLASGPTDVPEQPVLALGDDFEVLAAFEPGTQQTIQPASGLADVPEQPVLLDAQGEEHIYVEMVRLLSELKADPNQANDKQTVPLGIAVHNSRTEVVKLLLEVKADPDPAPDNWGSFPMMSAAEEAHEHVEILRELGKYGADPNRVQTESYWKPTGGKTPLLFACQKGYLDIVQALCELKADPNQTTDDGVSCLMYAANNGQLEAMRMLCGFGSNPNQTMDSGGAGALLLMATEGQTEAVRVLLELKADPNQAKTNGHTPILCARHFATQGKPGCQEVVTLLEAAGA